MDLDFALAFLTLFAIMCIFAIGFMVGAKQEQKRLAPKEYEVPNEVREQLQKLAGIIEHDRSEGSKVLADIMDDMTKKRDASVSMFKDIDIQNKKEYERLGLHKAKEVLDKSIESTERFNEYRKNNSMPKAIKNAMISPYPDKTEIPENLLKQNRAEIEANEAASIQLTGESDSHYYYKQSKDTNKSDNNTK